MLLTKTPRRFTSSLLTATGTKRGCRPEFYYNRPWLWWLFYKRSGLCIYGPEGFVTDKMSIPSIARLMGCKPDGVGWEASGPHDLGYEGAPVLRVDVSTGEVLNHYRPKREEFDGLFYSMLIGWGGSEAYSRRLFHAVSAFGGRAWARDNDPFVSSVPDRVPFDLME